MRRDEILKQIKKIMEKHKGKKNSISAGEIAKVLNLKQENTHVEPRMYFYETMETYKIPIAGGGRGYYIVTSKQELNNYLDGLDGRINGINKRKRVVQTAFKEYYGE